MRVKCECVNALSHSPVCFVLCETDERCSLLVQDQPALGYEEKRSVQRHCSAYILGVDVWELCTQNDLNICLHSHSFGDDGADAARYATNRFGPQLEYMQPKINENHKSGNSEKRKTM